MADKTEKARDRPFPFETVAVLLAVMKRHGINLSTADYKVMSALDGKRGWNGFQHEFRAVQKRANEINERHKAGESFEPVEKSKALAGKSTSNKRARTGKVKEEVAEEEEEEAEESQRKKPNKRFKAEPPVDDDDTEEYALGDLPDTDIFEDAVASFDVNDLLG
ncbi:MAG: hypothetical protein M1820_003477 [Bogoriella megaspora]|nr:MAG: hypothetical protein M1820_003477 [Bogoriella megaspora]